MTRRGESRFPRTPRRPRSPKLVENDSRPPVPRPELTDGGAAAEQEVGVDLGGYGHALAAADRHARRCISARLSRSAHRSASGSAGQPDTPPSAHAPAARSQLRRDRIAPASSARPIRACVRRYRLTIEPRAASRAAAWGKPRDTASRPRPRSSASARPFRAARSGRPDRLRGARQQRSIGPESSAGVRSPRLAGLGHLFGGARGRPRRRSRSSTRPIAWGSSSRAAPGAEQRREQVLVDGRSGRLRSLRLGSSHS